jgi:4-hydroxybenzoate polyprenyltransferase
MRVRLGRALAAWRIDRIAMMALVTGSTAYGFGATPAIALKAGLTASFLALGGFYLDHLADWQKDREAGNTLNPIARGALSPLAARILVVASIGISVVLGCITNLWVLLPLAAVLVIVVGLAAGVLDTPFPRAVSLGALQAMYVLIGGLSAGVFGWGLVLTAVFLLFAMTGGRVLGDVRDLPYDVRTDKMTLPRKYGVYRAALFLLANETVAYFVAPSAYWVGALGLGYLYCILAIIVSGTVINIAFVARPTPRMADVTNRLSLGILGMLYVLGMVLGRKG